MIVLIFRSLESGTIDVSDSEIHELGRSIDGSIYLPGTEEYENSRKIWNGIFRLKPSAIVNCMSPGDVSKAVRFAKTHNLLVSVKSGGHSITGKAMCDGCLAISLSDMRGVTVDAENRTAVAEGGALLSDVDIATQEYGLATPFGVVSMTGIAGLTLGGGYGHLRRKYGLTVDNLLSVEIVTAEGDTINASEDENSDLFWAVRGGGGNFGIVTKFQYRLHEVGPDVYFVYTSYPLEEAGNVVRKARDYLFDKVSDKVSAEFQFAKVPDTDNYPEATRGKRVLVVRGMYSGTIEEGRKEMDFLRKITTPLLDESGVMPYLKVQSYTDGTVPNGMRYYSTGVMVEDINDDALDILIDEYSKVTFAETGVTGVWHTGGAIGRVGLSDTPYIARDNNFMIVIDCGWTDPKDDDEQIAWGRNLKKRLLSAYPGISERGYINFQPGDDNQSETSAAYGENTKRLREIKRKYDPENFFRLNHNIKP